MTDQTPPSDPQPPYPCRLPGRFADMPFDQLPAGLQQRVLRAIAGQDTTGT